MNDTTNDAAGPDDAAIADDAAMPVRPAVADIEARLLAAFPGATLSVRDDSHLHAGHAGARGGAGHYAVDIRHDSFTGRTRIAQHRLVYDALAEWIPRRIHALVVRSSGMDEAVVPPTQRNPE